MKRVALVTAHFPPSNLVGVHRSRLWAEHLPEFGWAPTVVTSHWEHYQEPLDWELLELVPENVRIVRTKALGVRFAKVVGNMALRALWWTRKELARLAERGEVDFMHIIVPDHYSALLGPMLHRSHRLPYGIDFMDPWVHAKPGEKAFLSKAWISCALSYYLEPWSVRSARLITGVSSASIDDVVTRNRTTDGRPVIAEIPMISSSADYRVLTESYRPRTKLFDPNDGRTHIVYVGTLPPSFDESLGCFLSAMKECIDRNVFGKEVRVWLIGTGTASHGGGRFRVRAAIEALSLGDVVTEHPSRIGYVDALWHLKAASAVVVLGSSEAHYTPSKVYQGIHSGNPVLALVPEDSAAAAVVRSGGRGIVVDFPGDRPAVIGELERALGRLVHGRFDRGTFVDDEWESHSAREGARRLAESLDRACDAREPAGRSGE